MEHSKNKDNDNHSDDNDDDSEHGGNNDSVKSINLYEKNLLSTTILLHYCTISVVINSTITLLHYCIIVLMLNNAIIANSAEISKK